MNSFIRINQAEIRRDRNMRRLKTGAWLVAVVLLSYGAGYLSTCVLLKDQLQ